MALQDKLIDALGRFATTFNSYRYIMAIKSAFITLMPVIIVGAFSVLISNMVLDPKNGLASFSSLSFLAALKPITSALNYATLNFLNIGAVFLIGIELGRINGIKSLFPGLLAVICFINIWCGYPFYMISILAGLQGISGDLYESAAIDGATGVKSFLHITIPQLKPILISIAMLDFIWTLQSFNVIWMLTGGGPVNATETVSIYIYKKAFQKVDYSMAATAATILLVVCIFVAIFYVKQQKKVRE